MTRAIQCVIFEKKQQQMNTNAMNRARTDKILQKKYNFQEGVMTRMEWIQLMVSIGATVKIGTKCPTRWNRTKFNRMDYKEQGAYEKKLAVRVPCYELYRPGQESIYTEITKTEFDFFNQLKTEQ